MFRATFVALAAIPAVASADITLTSEAFGSTTPGLVESTSQLVNGDFLIHENALAPWTGDGVDEMTTWRHAFGNDPGYATLMQADHTITSAVLTLTLTQFFQSGPPTDVVRPFDIYPLISIPLFLDAGETGTIQFELTDYYSSADLKGLLAFNNGYIPMVYADDAIVSYARIDITAVPTPGSLALFGLGLMAMRRRR